MWGKQIQHHGQGSAFTDHCPSLEDPPVPRTHFPDGETDSVTRKGLGTKRSGSESWSRLSVIV